jgi:hypothetical protein
MLKQNGAPAAPRRALGVRLQVGKVDPPLQLHRSAAGDVLRDHPGLRIRLLGERRPEVPHPRWSQASERVLGTDERAPTQLFNGYADYVADLYRGLEGERLDA